VTIERAKDWGWRGPRPADVVEVADDAAAARIVCESRLAGTAVPTIGLLGGDLRRTLGHDDHVERLGSEVAVFTVDIGLVELDGTPWTFVGHLIARRHWWWGEVLAVMNAEFRGRWDVAPRSHPNDGRLDVLHVVDMALGERYKAWRRLASGTHLPHPGIRSQRVAATTVRLSRPLPVALDGVSVGVATDLSIRVEPDALTVCV
jgi:hypothetical protein